VIEHECGYAKSIHTHGDFRKQQMKAISYLVSVITLAAATAVHAQSAGSMLRISCEGEDVGAEVSINGKFRGACPVDVQVAAGTLQLQAVKKVDATHERAFIQELRIGEGSVKKIDVRLGLVQLSAEERRRETERTRVAQQEARKREEERQRAEAETLRSEQQAAKDARTKAVAGDPAAMTTLSYFYRTGKGVEKSEVQTVFWLRKAVDAHYPQAMTALAVSYANGFGVPQDYQQARALFGQAAEAGDPVGMCGLGGLYFNGAGMEKNAVEAEKWWRRAADAGEGQGMRGLAMLYAHGINRPQDLNQAAAWFEKSANLGDVPSMHNLGLMYKQGQASGSVTPAQLFLRASELGYADSMAEVGNLYMTGEGGMPEDRNEAYNWYEKAAAAGSVDAQEFLKVHPR
jgi:TPR repeat protein